MLPLRDSAGLAPVFPHCAPCLRATGAPLLAYFLMVGLREYQKVDKVSNLILPLGVYFSLCYHILLVLEDYSLRFTKFDTPIIFLTIRRRNSDEQDRRS